MAKITDATQALVIKLQALYDIEGQLEKALPKMEKAASDPALKEGFRTHLEETREHTRRLESAFDILGEKPKKLRSEGIRGIVEDGAWVMKADAPEPVKDAMLASAARYAEHYEMAGYMSAIELAKLLGLSDLEETLAETLAEEEMADRKLVDALRKNAELV